jgi:hypothetical protein
VVIAAIGTGAAADIVITAAMLMAVAIPTVLIIVLVITVVLVTTIPVMATKTGRSIGGRFPVIISAGSNANCITSMARVVPGAATYQGVITLPGGANIVAVIIKGCRRLSQCGR